MNLEPNAKPLLSDKDAEAAINTITTNRILLWHGACSKELEARGLTKPEADDVAMQLFTSKCQSQRSYLGWPNADTVAQAFDIESLDRDGGDEVPA